MTKFQHTAARRRLHGLSWSDVTTNLFQHTAARRRLPEEVDVVAYVILSFNTQPPEGGCSSVGPFLGRKFVSTHSRPKAAAGASTPLPTIMMRFNTQPPEGGCLPTVALLWRGLEFQHTAARRRLPHAVV